MTEREQATLQDDNDQPDQADSQPVTDPDFTDSEIPTAKPAAPEEEAPVESALETIEPESLQWAESTGAYVLGVLPPEDADAAGQEFRQSAALQAELATLLPVADILLNLYQTQPPAIPAAEPVAAPVAPSPSRPSTERRAVEPERAAVRTRPTMSRRPARSTLGGLNPSTVLIGVLAAVAAIGVLWALALSDRMATKDDEIDALQRQITEFRQAANASAFSLTRTEDAPEEARGTVFYSLADSRVLIDVSGLPDLDEDRVYQTWFQRTGDADWEPGPSFLVNEQGESVQRLPGDTTTFVRIAVSEEPAPGSGEPTGPFLLEGQLAGANG